MSKFCLKIRLKICELKLLPKDSYKLPVSQLDNLRDFHYTNASV